MEKNMQPIYIMPENTQRSQGRQAQRNNIMAAKLVAEAVRTTLGPKGMDKMIVDAVGDIIITNDGATILEEMQIEHPAAKMIVEVAKTQESEVGDGTTTAVILAGELLKNAEILIDQEVHPTIIAKGYRLAQEKSKKILNNISEDLQQEDLIKIAQTAMTGKGAESSKEHLSKIVVDAILTAGKNNIKIEKKFGPSVDDSELIQGIVIDKEIVNSNMPKKASQAKILLLDRAIEIKDTEIDAKISITSPEQMQQFLDQEERMLKSMVDKIVSSGANVIFCQKGIDDLAQHFLAKQNIIAIRRVKKSDMEKIAKATNATILTNLEINEKHLGKADVEEQKIHDEEMIFIKNCQNPKAVTILLRGSTEHITDEISRAIDDALGDVDSAIKNKKVVAGAGSTEIILTKELQQFAQTLSGREQLAVEAFAKSIEIIPRTLAENAGLDPIDVLTELKSATEKWSGIDVFTGKVMNAWNQGIIEPLKIKTQAINSASEVAIMILRIDDVIAGFKQETPPNMPPMQ